MANSEIGSGGSLNSLAQIYYNKIAQDRLVKNFVFYKTTDKKNIGKNTGQTAQFYRFDDIAGTTTTLAESTLTAGQAQLSSRVATTAISQYGQFITVSNFAQMTGRTDFLTAAAEVLADSASDTVDLIVKGVLDANAAAHVVGQTGTAYLSASNSASVTATDVMDSATIKKVRRDLRSSDVKEFSDGSAYIGIFSPDVMYDFFSDDTVGGFTQTMQYSKPGEIIKGEAGKLWGVRLVESTQCGSTDNGDDVAVYDSYIVGAHSMLAVNIIKNPIEILIKEPGSGGTSDPYSNIGTVAYKLPAFGVASEIANDAKFATAGARAGHARAYRIYSAAS